MIALSSMALFCFVFERLESEWITSIYPAGRRLSHSKVSFETAGRLHLLAPLFYGADNRFIRPMFEFLDFGNLDFRFEFSVYGFRI